MEQSKVTLNRTILADHITNVGFTESHYVKENRKFFAVIQATEKGWCGYYQTVSGHKLVRNGKIVMVESEEPLKTIQLLDEASKIVSLTISDEYVNSLNENDAN